MLIPCTVNPLPLPPPHFGRGIVMVTPHSPKGKPPVQSFYD
jgi:hypothetical protein